MKIFNFEKHIHVLDGKINSASVVRNIAKRNPNGDAFFVADLGEIERRINEWKHLLPRVKPYYAVKCNDNKTVLKLMAALGLNFDCASKVEIDKILNLGLHPNRIIYANPVKQISHLQHAAMFDVDLHTIDNESELYKYQKYYPSARLLIRIKCDDPTTKVKFGAKFGCDYLTEASSLLRTAKELNLNMIGVCFHVGSGVVTPNIFHTAIDYARQVFDYAETIGYKFQILDIGGGMLGRSNTALKPLAVVINNALEEFFPDQKVTIISEPGQYFVDAAFTLACNIVSKRMFVECGRTHNVYYINDGVFGSFNNVVFDLMESEPKSLKKYNDGILIVSDIWGQTLHPSDKVAKNVLLPDMNEGDWIVYEEMGAYSSVAVTNFNGFTKSKVYTVVSKSLWLALKDTLPFTEEDFVLDKLLVIEDNDLDL